MSEGGHVMKMNFNTDLPLGKMLFINWEVDDQSDLAWVLFPGYFQTYFH